MDHTERDCADISDLILPLGGFSPQLLSVMCGGGVGWGLGWGWGCLPWMNTRLPRTPMFVWGADPPLIGSLTPGLICRCLCDDGMPHETIVVESHNTPPTPHPHPSPTAAKTAGGHMPLLKLTLSLSQFLLSA